MFNTDIPNENYFYRDRLDKKIILYIFCGLIQNTPRKYQQIEKIFKGGSYFVNHNI